VQTWGRPSAFDFVDHAPQGPDFFNQGLAPIPQASTLIRRTAYKLNSEPLHHFIKRKGGINAFSEPGAGNGSEVRHRLRRICLESGKCFSAKSFSA